MKWKVDFIPTPPHVLVEFDGEFDLDDTLKLHEQLAVNDHVLTGSPILIDARRILTPNINSDDIDALARSFARHAESFSNTRIAFYVSSNVHFGLGRQLQGFMGEGAGVLALLRTEEEVAAWLEN
jgi:hypothetical protein